ncbi:hypothetical protein AAC387_Pa03g1149 [Persea americana]
MMQVYVTVMHLTSRIFGGVGAEPLLRDDKGDGRLSSNDARSLQRFIMGFDVASTRVRKGHHVDGRCCIHVNGSNGRDLLKKYGKEDRGRLCNWSERSSETLT